MSLRRIAPNLLSRYNCGVSAISTKTTTLVSNRIKNNTTAPSILRRKFSSPPASNNAKNKMTKEEVDAALEKANESMKDYYSYPPSKVVAAKKAKFEQMHGGGQFYLQLALGASLVCSFLLTPFIGRKIAYDEEFRNKYIPSWYDYSIERPKSAWTKEELHEQVMLLRRQLHERAAAGEFTPEKLEEMRRNLQKKPELEEHAHFAQLHPGVDDDEDLED